MERTIIRQHEAMITSPQDAGQARGLITTHMSDCFAYSVFDPKEDVGLLAHVQPFGELIGLKRMVRNASPVLRELGAKNVYVETANAKSMLTRKIVESTVDELLKNGLEVYLVTNDEGDQRETRDVGPAFGVIFDSTTGLQPFSENEMGKHLTYAERVKLHEMTSKISLGEALNLLVNPTISLRPQPQH